VKSKLTKQFRKQFARLPRDIQDQAKADYRLFKEDPHYPSLHFKCIDSQESLWSVRIGLHYRAVGVWEGDTIIWYFIGTHEEYNHLL
jgi:mRNA-degrading endonuclease RelE of RelBE toxin-antitoxin system